MQKVNGTAVIKYCLLRFKMIHSISIILPDCNGHHLFEKMTDYR